MRRVLVRYKVKKERLEEHVALIRAVFDELAKNAPSGIRYAVFKQPDGVSFVHVAFVDAEKNPLDAVGPSALSRPRSGIAAWTHPK